MKRTAISALLRAIFICLALLVSLPVVNASKQKADEGPQNAPVESAVKPVSENARNDTKASVVLPSQRYGLQFQLEQLTHSLDPLAANAAKPIEPNQIGTGRIVAIASNHEGRLFINPNRSKVRIIAIKSPGALALRAHFEAFDLPIGDQVYVYGQLANSHVAGPYESRGPLGSTDFWSDTIEGDTVIIEHYIQGKETTFSISQLSHIYRGVASSEVTPNALSCHNDAMCFNDREADAVGRIVYLRGGNSFLCTGTLLNNRERDFAPFFLTANHCISTPSEAQTVEVYWFYRTTSCNSGVVSNSWVRSSPSGAELLANSREADSSLIKITGAIPGGTLFSGWDPRSKSTGTAIFSLSHPDGGIPPSTLSYLRRASGQIVNDNTSCAATGLTSGYRVEWSSGATEPGSSGSGIWITENGEKYLIGVDSCGQRDAQGEPFCGALTSYSKFSDFYPLIQNYMNNGLCLNPVIESTLTFGKELRVLGSCFDNGAQLLLNGKSQKKTSNDSQNPARVLIDKKAGKKIRPGDRLQVRNPSGALSNEFIYGCTYSLSSLNAPFAAAGGSASISLTTQSGCSWQAVSNADWITITSGSNGNGNGAVSYFVAANNSQAPRTGTLSIARQTFTVTQAGGLRANLQIAINPSPVSPSANSCSGIRPAWGYAITITETAGVGININKVTVDYFDGNGNLLNTQTESGDFFAALFNGCGTASRNIVARARACGTLCTHLSGRSNGSILWTFYGIDDNGNSLTFPASRLFLLGSAPASNRVLNPGFEDGLASWTESTPLFVISNDARHSARTGSWYAWLGGADNLAEYAYQDVTIPANATQASLEFWYQIFTAEAPGPSCFDQMWVEIRRPGDNTLLATLSSFCNSDNTSFWIRGGPFDLLSFRGQTIRLRFYCVTDGSLITSFIVDDIVLIADGN